MRQSPDQRYVAYLTSNAGFHNLWVYDAHQQHSERIFSLWEADPGSGVSFRYFWLEDSPMLVVVGSCGGFSRSRREFLEIQIAYAVSSNELFDVRSSGERDPN